MKSKLFYRLKDKILHIGASWDKLALNEKNAIEFAEKYINKEPNRYQEGSHTVFSPEYCLAHSAESINERIRKDIIEDIDMEIAETLNSNQTTTDLIVYRGVCEPVYKLMKENAKIHKKGDLYEKAFMSTSLVKNHEIPYQTKLRIFVPAGTKCIFMGNVNDEMHYYEVAIQHGAALKIISIDDEYINCRLLTTS